MKPKFPKQFFIFLFLLFITSTGYAQKEFFRSQQVFTAEQMNEFYSSVTLHDSLVFFNANDYTLYAYNRTGGSLKWSYKTSYKSNTPVFVQGNDIFTGIYAEKIERSARLDLANGQLIKVLPFGVLSTKPLIKNGMLYGTALYDYGCIVAYDLAKDTVTWSRFIAHGYSTQPYYLDNKIIANAEGNNWVYLGYDGALLDTTCKVKASMFVEHIPCVKIFKAMTHDGLEIKGKLAEEIMGEESFGTAPMLTSSKFTYVLYDDKLTILSGKLKVKLEVDIASLVPDLTENNNTRLIKADNEKVWMLYRDQLLQYDHQSKKLVRSTDLTNWQPHRVLVDGQNIWLISGKDGLLYGLSL